LGLFASSPAPAADFRPASSPPSFARLRERGLNPPPASTIASKAKASTTLQATMRPFAIHDGFYDAYLVPRMSARLRGENLGATSDLADPLANPWTKDEEALDRVEHRALRATKGALKKYAIERLGIDRWSIPLVGGRHEREASATEGSRNVRLSLGISHLAPRADVSVPAGEGRVSISADVRGHIGATFEPASSRMRIAADASVRDHTATVRMSFRF